MPIAPTPDELSAIEACREAARRYCRGIDRLDGALMKSAYWPDATDDHGTYVGNAHDFVDRCMESHTRWAWTMHIVTNHVVEIDESGTEARGEAYNVSFLADPDGGLAVWFGRYLDRYQQRGREWRIVERVCVHEGNRFVAPADAMPIAAELFRQGSFDRSVAGRPVGP